MQKGHVCLMTNNCSAANQTTDAMMITHNGRRNFHVSRCASGVTFLSNLKVKASKALYVSTAKMLTGMPNHLDQRLCRTLSHPDSGPQPATVLPVNVIYAR